MATAKKSARKRSSLPTDFTPPASNAQNAWKSRITGTGYENPADLLANPFNARIHPKNQQAAMESVLNKIGWVTDVIVNTTTGHVLDGHMRVTLALRKEEATVPVKYVELSVAEERALLAMFDKIGSMAGVDAEKVHELAGDVRDILAGAPGMDDLLASMFPTPDDPAAAATNGASASTGDPSSDEFEPNLPKEPRTKPGDLIILGRHRLYCGDSTENADVDALLGAVKPAMVLTDPPYAIYGSSTGIASDITDDNMVRPFFRDILRQIARVLPTFGHFYVCCDWRSYASWWEVCRGTGLVPKNCIVWNKGGAGLGSNYANTHEWLLFGSRIPMQKNMRTKRTGIVSVNDSNVWNINRVAAQGVKVKNGENREHNAQKPLALFSRAVNNSTKEGQSVLDLFGGSGTTLIVAEQSNRTAFIMEKSPAWCDVIAARFEKATGLTAEWPKRGGRSAAKKART